MAKKLRKPGIAGSALALLAILASPAAAAAPQALGLPPDGYRNQQRRDQIREPGRFGEEIRLRHVRRRRENIAREARRHRHALDKVAISQTSMTGAAEHISVGIDRSSWRIVFQTYEEGVTRNEFGNCRLRP